MNNSLAAYWWYRLDAERKMHSDEIVFAAKKLAKPLSENYTMFIRRGHYVCQLKKPHEQFYGSTYEEALAKASFYRFLERKVSKSLIENFLSIRAAWISDIIHGSKLEIEHANKMLMIFKDL